MESANLHHQHMLNSSSSSSSSSLVGISHIWSPNIAWNNNTLSQNSNGIIFNSRELGQENELLVQNSSFTNFTNQMKEEISDSFPKFTEMLNPNSFISNELSEKLLQAEEFYSNARNSSGFDSNSIPARGNFSQIYPSVYISNNSNQSNLRSMEMNLQAMDLLTSSRFGGFELDGMQQPHSCNSTKIPTFPNGAKRSADEQEQLEPRTSQATTKKSRLVSHSCPPFKVRKEKLGDRIAALQQLVAPFGKTDTASVLMEAIGYIKFLQNQIETLSVPYMKSSSKCRARQLLNLTDVTATATATELTKELKRDLKSRGLCLVPLSCMSYITNGSSGGGGIWPMA